MATTAYLCFQAELVGKAGPPLLHGGINPEDLALGVKRDLQVSK